MKTVIALLLFSGIAAAATTPAMTGFLTLQVQDADGRGIAGTTAALEAKWVDQKSGSFSRRDGQLEITMRPGSPRTTMRSDAHGELKLPASAVFGSRQLDTTKTTLLVINEVQKLGAVIDVSPADLAQTVSVTLEPLCFVHGKLDSPDMEAQGHVLKHITAWVELKRGRTPPFKCESENGRFGMLLPVGTYEVSVGGVATDGATYNKITQPIEVEKGKAELDLDTLHFEASKLSELLGKPAPEMSGIIEWKYGDPVTLEQLKGKVVVLDFWAWSCSICIEHMPELFALQKQYANEPDLVIIAVHAPNASSIDEAFEKCAKAREKAWHVSEFPFRIALDGQRGFMSALGVTGVPNLLLIDREGKVDQRFWNAGVAGFKEEVARLLNTAPKSRTTTTVATSSPIAPSATSKPVLQNPALATPESALRAFLTAKKRGEAAAYRKVVSARVIAAMEAESGGTLKIEPEEFFTKLTVLDVKIDKDIAIVNAKVVYNRKWLDAHNKDLAAMETSSGAPAGVVKFQLDSEHGEMQWDDPIAAGGEGFAAFAILKEADGWRFHLGYMSDKQANLKQVSDVFIGKSDRRTAARP